MQPRTKSTLDELRQAAWFASVGQPASENVSVLQSWREAVESCSSDTWEDLLLEAANQYRERLNERNPRRFMLWNQCADELKPIVVALVAEKTRWIEQAHKLAPVFRETVEWDMLHVCMEAEFADVYPPGFFASQAYWYVQGRFPCGWDGEFPDGKLIIY